MEPSAIKNRLQKNLKKLKTFLKKNQIEAFRLYGKDIPEYPYLIDVYADQAVIYEQGKRLDEEELPIQKIHQDEISAAITEVLSIPVEKQHFKVRTVQKGQDQYKPIDPKSNEFFTVQEPPMTYLVNLERYLDTGLFLDHRPLRKYLIDNSKEKRVLNLFCYTGSLSVAAAIGGAKKVTSVDMSRTYLDWAYENFLINKLDASLHRFEQADVLKDLPIRREKKESFDLILLDPPSFSNSKRMEEDLDVDRDHPILIRDCMNLLAPGGMLIFSTNKRRFELHDIVTSQYQVKEITHWTIPQDFHFSQIHRAYQITVKPS